MYSTEGILMNITYLEVPVPHVIIDDFYNTVELNDIWKEINFLTSSRKLEPPQNTGGAPGEHGEILKQNHGVWLDALYTKRELSDILTYSRKLYSKEMLEFICPKHYLMDFLQYSDEDTSLLSYYENGGHYKPHSDKAALTALTWLFREPKMFTGGELSFSDYNYQIELKNNRLVLFCSMVKHSVSDVVMSEGTEPLTGFGRYVISNFIKFRS
jgi:Rps23 Pro-64 3,4-dihydroxylase Tpa1-like proline 4-hydroxylase